MAWIVEERLVNSYASSLEENMLMGSIRHWEDVGRGIGMFVKLAGFTFKISIFLLLSNFESGMQRLLESDAANAD